MVFGWQFFLQKFGKDLVPVPPEGMAGPEIILFQLFPVKNSQGHFISLSQVRVMAPINLDKRSPLWADYATDAAEKKRYFCLRDPHSGAKPQPEIFYQDTDEHSAAEPQPKILLAHG